MSSMQVIMPLAGKGTRLLPITNDTPKPLVRVAGRPVLQYQLEAIRELDVDELVLITGHLGDEIEDYVGQHYDGEFRVVEQQTMTGTGGAVHLTKHLIDRPVLILFADTLFDADLSIIETSDCDGILWVHEVEDYQRFGVILTDESGCVQEIVEKPTEPVSKMANIGLYYIRDWQAMFEGLDAVVSRPAIRGEWYLTYAFQDMIRRGRKIRTAPTESWLDCGKLDTLLDTNFQLLRARRDAPGSVALGPNSDGVLIHEPVQIAEGVRLDQCTIGPNVTIEEGSVVRSSQVSHSLIGRRCEVVDSTVRDSMLGENVEVRARHVQGEILARDRAEVQP